MYNALIHKELIRLSVLPLQRHGWHAEGGRQSINVMLVRQLPQLLVHNVQYLAAASC
jgi:hypothetical protein